MSSLNDLTSPTRPQAGTTGFGSTMAASNTGVGGLASSPSSAYQAEAARYDSLKGGNSGVSGSSSGLRSELSTGASDASSTYGRSMPAAELGSKLSTPQTSSYSTESYGSSSGSSGLGSSSLGGSSLGDSSLSSGSSSFGSGHRLGAGSSSSYDSTPSTSASQYSGPARGSGSSLEDKVHRYFNSVSNHPQVQQLTTTGKQVHQQYIQPVADKVLTQQTQHQVRGQMERLGLFLHNLRHQYDRSFFSFVEDVVHTKATPTLLGLITWLLTFELVLPLFYFNQAEARVSISAAIGTIAACHAIWYALGRQIRPLVLGGFAVQIPLFLYLMFAGGLGGGYASELALAIDAAQRSVKHAGEIATLSNYYYVYILWVRAVMVGSAVILSHAAPAIRDDLIAYRRGQVATGSLNTTASLQQHSSLARSSLTGSDSTYSDRTTTSRSGAIGSGIDAGGSHTVPAGTRTTGTETQSTVGDYLPSESTVNNITAKASNIASQVATAASNLVNSAITTASNNLPSQSRVNDLKDQAKETAQQVSNKASDLTQQASNQASRAYEQAPSTSDLKASARNAADTVSSKANEVSNAASQQASRAYEQAPSTSDIKDTIASKTPSTQSTRSYEQTPASTTGSNVTGNEMPTDSFREHVSSSTPATTHSKSSYGSSALSNDNNIEGLNALTKDESVIGSGSSYGRSSADSNTHPPEQNPDNFEVHQPQTVSRGATSSSSYGSQSYSSASPAKTSSYSLYDAPTTSSYQSSTPSYTSSRSTGNDNSQGLSALTKDESVIGSGSSFGRSTDSNTRPAEQSTSNFSVHQPQTSYSGSSSNNYDSQSYGSSSPSRQSARPAVQAARVTGYEYSAPGRSADSVQSVRQVDSSDSYRPSASEHKYTTSQSSSSQGEGDVNDKRHSTTFALNPLVSDQLQADHRNTITSQAAVVDTPFGSTTPTSSNQVRFLPYE